MTAKNEIKAQNGHNSVKVEQKNSEPVVRFKEAKKEPEEITIEVDDSTTVIPSPTISPVPSPAPSPILGLNGELDQPQFYHVKVVLIVTQPAIRLERPNSGARRVTSACDFRFQEIVIGAIRVKLQIWELAYDETHFSVLSFYLPGTQCAIILYDVSDRDSFDRALTWIGEVKKRCPSAGILLAGSNSEPLNNIREVTQDEATTVVNRIPEVLLAVEVNGSNDDELDELLRRAAIKFVELRMFAQQLAQQKAEQEVTNNNGKKVKKVKVKRALKQKNPCSVM